MPLYKLNVHIRNNDTYEEHDVTLLTGTLKQCRDRLTKRVEYLRKYPCFGEHVYTSYVNKYRKCVEAFSSAHSHKDDKLASYQSRHYTIEKVG